MIRTKLTNREEGILKLIANGLSNKEIAMYLGLSVKTIDAHRANIRKKLNINTIPDLVKYAIRNGIISINE